MHWYRATRSLHKDWAPFRTRVVWTAMITMHEHLLRLGEVVQPAVDTQTGKRRWTRASVSFWMGEKQIPLLPSGAPDPRLRQFLTHAQLGPPS